MKKIAVALLIISLTFGCKTKTEKQMDSPEEEAATEMMEEKMETPYSTLEIGCYSYDANGNKIHFEITEVSSTVVGNLDYALKEKDANAGTFAGSVQDSVLVGSYTFGSEGMESTREVAFLIKDGHLIEGYGALNETGTAFQDKSALSFSSSMPLSKTECDSE